jgi:two-component system, LuxR family, sensor histidine kinase DctS
MNPSAVDHTGPSAATPPAPRTEQRGGTAYQRLRLRGRWLLWSMLIVLLAALLGLLVWLTGRYEASAVQSRLDTEAAAVAGDLRNGLTRNLRHLQVLLPDKPALWTSQSSELMQQRREIMRIEWRDAQMQRQLSVDSPVRAPVFGRISRDQSQADVNLACGTALRFNSAAYSNSYFVPQPDGLGLELMDLCIPQSESGRLVGFTLATYALSEMLLELGSAQLPRGHALAFTEADGTRLALYGQLGQGQRLYSAQQLLDLPGNTLVVRMETRQGTAALFPNPLSALVSSMALALLLVLLLLVRDVRRRQKVEHDLAEALAFRNAMENSLSTGLRARDLQGKITYVNPAFCKMVGFEAQQLLHSGQEPPYWPPEMVQLYQQRQQDRHNNTAVLRGGHESVFLRSDGSRFPVLIMEAPLINAQGRHTGWMSAVLDISEQKRNEDLSRASQDRLQATARLAMVGEMASLLSHELNQPLAAIASYASGSVNLLQEAQHGAAREPGGLPGDLLMALQRIAEQAERAGKVIRSVHDFVRRREQPRQAVAPQDLLDAVMPLVSLQARKLAVRVLTHIAPGCPEVWCDRTMVEQVLLNLARNGMQAMQHTPGPAAQRLLELHVRPAQAERWVEFCVSDVGQGIAPPVAQQLFTPFFTTKEEGMGLGLSLCRTVVEQHGGTLRFETHRPQGTVFHFTLPAASGPAVLRPTALTPS